MSALAVVMFWGSLGLVLYVYAGYPVLLFLFGFVREAFGRRPAPARRARLPRVTLIISAYNEEDVIREKIINSLALDYPRDRLEIIVASDGSTDRTAAIAAEYAAAGVRLLHYPGRRGKNATLNDVVPQARGEIIVFTDANGKYERNALATLVRDFADPQVGCVCGELVYLSADDNVVARGYNVYWRYDQRLKRLESRLACLLGANGSIFAIRKTLYRPLLGSVSNDMVLPIQIAARGYHVVYEPAAISREAGSQDAPEELGRRSRIVGRGILGVRAVLPDVLRGRRILLLWELLSRKFLRYCTPIFLATLAVSSAWLWTGIYGWALAAQAAFYGLAVLSLALRRLGVSVRGLSLPHYFVLGNVAAALGWWKVVAGRELTKWETVARTYDAQIPAAADASLTLTRR
ncbi:MAG TPA: glycosyltransferase family 2 protein [Methylomirabilota bacterium]|jgi:cellulose synthase/poly-beta-1,6-N-acetylglucosamine synthase-like glycosyltransferase|nr:glycosyltransferase family 2 protein [Methylomirabilota bacterium]